MTQRSDEDPRDQRLTVRLTAALKAEIEARAAKEHRSVSDWIVLTLAEAVKRPLKK